MSAIAILRTVIWLCKNRRGESETVFDPSGTLPEGGHLRRTFAFLGRRCDVHVGSHGWQSCCIPNALFCFHTLDTNLTRSFADAHPSHTEPGSTGLVGNSDNLPNLQHALDEIGRASCRERV